MPTLQRLLRERVCNAIHTYIYIYQIIIIIIIITVIHAAIAFRRVSFSCNRYGDDYTRLDDMAKASMTCTGRVGGGGEGTVTIRSAATKPTSTVHSDGAPSRQIGYTAVTASDRS